MKMVKLVEVYRDKNFGVRNGFKLREVYVNPDHVVCMYDDPATVRNLKEGFLPDELDKRQSFTKLHLNQGQSLYQITVVGDTPSVQEKLGLTSKRQILHD